MFQILQGGKFVPDFTGGKNFVPELSKNEKIMCFFKMNFVDIWLCRKIKRMRYGSK